MGPKTKQLVKTETNTYPTLNDQFAHRFYLVVSGLDNYALLLFQVVHSITLYPLTVSWDGTGYSIRDQQMFLQKPKDIIGSEKTKRTIEALLAQVSGNIPSATKEVPDYRIEPTGTGVALLSERATQRGQGAKPNLGSIILFRTREDTAIFAKNSEAEGFTFEGKEYLNGFL